MIVYGKWHKKYILSQVAVSQDFDGAVYSVPANPDILVKIYQPEYRTAETEKLVIDTANGKCSMLDESPVDVVYTNGRFAGYIFEASAPVAPLELDDEPIPPVRQQREMNSLGVLLSSIAVGLCLSGLIFFVAFDWLRAMFGNPYCYWNFNGIPMIVGGWTLMLFAFIQFRDRGAQTIAIAFVAFILGAVVVFGLISLIVWLLSLAWTLSKAILPTVLTIIIVVWIVKAIFGKSWR